MTDIPRVKIDTDAEIEWIRLINRTVAIDNANAADHFNLGIVSDVLTWVNDTGDTFTALTKQGDTGIGTYVFQRATATGVPLTAQSTDDSTTNAVFRTLKSDGVTLGFSVGVDGNIAVAGNALNANNTILGTKTYTGSPNTTVNGFSNTITKTDAGSGQVRAIQAQMAWSATTGTQSGVLQGALFQTNVTATNGATMSAGVYAVNIRNIMSGNVTLPEVAGIYIEVPTNSGGGTITAQYGILIKNITVGGSNSAITTNAGNVIFNEAGDASTDFRVEGDANTHLLFVDAGLESVGINQSTVAGKLDINQSSTTFANPVLKLTQADVSEEFIRFVGTSANGVLTQSLVEAADVATFTPAGYKKINVQDDGNQIADGAYYVQFGTIA